MWAHIWYSCYNQSLKERAQLPAKVGKEVGRHTYVTVGITRIWRKEYNHLQRWAHEDGHIYGTVGITRIWREEYSYLHRWAQDGGHTYGTLVNCYNQDLKERVQLPSQVGKRGRPHNQNLKERVQLPAQVGTRGWPHIWYSCYKPGSEGKSTATCTGRTRGGQWTNDRRRH